MRKRISADFCKLARKIRCKFYFRENTSNTAIPPFYTKSNWNPPPGNEAIEKYIFNTRMELYNLSLKKLQSNLSENERKALKELSDNQNIVIRKADKNNTIVILNKSTYNEEAQFQLSGVHYKKHPPT
ncbi:hypothetical protein V1264_024586 [Littorina saxatilis]|uniref:Uncharacterized protein n=1 Tax=Littorina saxatilis TaxID=31220 RepID=A0AAN9AMJ0_9CAEN